MPDTTASDYVPKWIHEGAYSERDKFALSFILNRVIVEYKRQLGSFAKIKECYVRPVPLDGYEGTNGYTDLIANTITLHCLPRMGALELAGRAATIAHEAAHFIIDERLPLDPLRRKLANDLVHYAVNTHTYQFQKRYVYPMLWVKYGLPYLTVRMFDVANLLVNKEAIKRELLAGRGRGTHPILIGS
jgi:hypothetical protein